MFYSLLGLLLGLLLALIFSWTVSRRFLATAALALAAAVIAVRTRIGDREDETHRDAALKAIALANALEFALFAVLGLP